MVLTSLNLAAETWSLSVIEFNYAVCHAMTFKIHFVVLLKKHQLQLETSHNLNKVTNLYGMKSRGQLATSVEYVVQILTVQVFLERTRSLRFLTAP